jgi:3-oxoacyl-[acyl-carrier-protein] synthase III
LKAPEANSMRIIGTGHVLPGAPVHNDALSRVMDTNDEWIRQRTGIITRHFAAPGEPPSALGAEASRRALGQAGLEPKDVDYVLFNTMTPDHMFPGSGALLTAALGITCPALDLRTQCAAFLFSLQVTAGLLATGAAKRVLVVSAETHAGFMPWEDWDIVRGQREGKPSPEAWERATRHRGWSIIFGDGAGAVLFERGSEGQGLVSMDLATDGRYASELLIKSGFSAQPYLSKEGLAADEHLPFMDGKEVFKHAVTKLPKSVLAACRAAGVSVADVDWFLAHQANQRINDAIVDRLKIDPARVPSNIERIGNTSAATIPILLSEMRADGRLKPGQTLCFLALGAGLHWGAAVFRT